jgi:hypothetical protein
MAAFDLSIESVNNGRYRVTVMDSPSGTASTDINAPFTFDELAELSDALNGRAGLAAAELQKYQKQFGETLFKAIFTDAVGYAYSASQKATGNNALPIRLKLDKAGDLAALPWQWINDPEGQPITVSRLDKPQVFAPVGGLREALRYGLRGPRLAAAIVAFVGLVVLVLLLASRTPPDVDLVVTGIRFLPPRPAPGQIFKVTMTITNQGTTRSGPFVWAWFRDDPRGRSPDLTGREENGLGGGDTITVRGEYSFGWWDQYDSTGEVDRLRETSDKDINNNTTEKGFALVQSSNANFVIDFTVKPPADLVTAALDLKGKEFDLWHFKPSVDVTNASADCKTAILKIIVIDNENFVRTGLPNNNTTACDGLPMLFTFDDPFGGAQVDFVLAQPGKYTLTLLGKDGKPLVSTSKEFPSGAASLQLPANNAILKKTNGAVTVRFESGAGVRLQKLTLLQATNDQPVN